MNILLLAGALLLLLVCVGIGVFFLSLFKDSESRSEELPYEKKPFVFDAMTELTLFRTLLELYDDKYYVFPEIGYSKLIQVKKGVERKYRNKFDKKSADFVLCDKEHAVARLVIELDGTSHNSEKRMERDARVDKMMQDIGLPILHLKTSAMDKESVKRLVSEKLGRES
jgi:hypothetical protein